MHVHVTLIYIILYRYILSLYNTMGFWYYQVPGPNLLLCLFCLFFIFIYSLFPFFQALDNLVSSQAYSSLDTQQLMVSIVTIAVETMSKYQENNSDHSATISRLPFDTSQVDPTDFECVLCTW